MFSYSLWYNNTKNDQSFIQYIADNVDHNIRTLDGHGTFHGMGIIATCTPAKQYQRLIPKLTVTANDIAKVSRINIKFHKGPQKTDILKYNTFLTVSLTPMICFLWICLQGALYCLESLRHHGLE